MRMETIHNLFRLLPLLAVFPVALAAAPVCDSCPEFKPQKAQIDAHACCDKKAQIKKSHLPGDCNSCIKTEAQVPVKGETKADVSFIAIRLPDASFALFERSYFSFTTKFLHHSPAPPGAAFLVQHKLLV